MKKENNVFFWLPCSVVFVSTAHGEQRDIMTATAMSFPKKNRCWPSVLPKAISRKN